MTKDDLLLSAVFLVLVPAAAVFLTGKLVKPRLETPLDRGTKVLFVLGLPFILALAVGSALSLAIGEPYDEVNTVALDVWVSEVWIDDNLTWLIPKESEIVFRISTGFESAEELQPDRWYTLQVNRDMYALATGQIVPAELGFLDRLDLGGYNILHHGKLVSVYGAHSGNQTYLTLERSNRVRAIQGRFLLFFGLPLFLAVFAFLVFSVAGSFRFSD